MRRHTDLLLSRRGLKPRPVPWVPPLSTHRTRCLLLVRLTSGESPELLLDLADLLPLAIKSVLRRRITGDTLDDVRLLDARELEPGPKMLADGNYVKDCFGGAWRLHR